MGTGGESGLIRVDEMRRSKAVILETETTGSEYTVARRLTVEDPTDAVVQAVADKFFEDE